MTKNLKKAINQWFCSLNKKPQANLLKTIFLYNHNSCLYLKKHIYNIYCSIAHALIVLPLQYETNVLPLLGTLRVSSSKSLWSTTF